MMTIPAYSIFSATPLGNEDYFPFLLDRFDTARSQIWASIFIVDARIYRDPKLSIRTAIERLAYARWRNVDVRILVGTSDTPEIYIANLTSALYMQQKGLDVRFFRSPHKHSLHSKYVVIDRNAAIVGSHNWTHNAFHSSTEDSIAINSPDLAISLVKEFEVNWQSSIKITEVIENES
jgi:phosphatidylserine/phosphatidylglycerophosphate/cardiolipin synthase-like enzyme